MKSSQLRLLNQDESRNSLLGPSVSSATSQLKRGDISGLVGGKTEFGSSDISILPERHDAFAKSTYFDAPPASFGSHILSSAVSVPSEVLVDGTIVSEDPDFYGINLVAGQTYLFSAYGSGADPLTDSFLYLLDGGGNLIDFDDDGGAGTNSLLTFTASTSGLYFLGVGGFPGAGLTGDYTLDAVVAPPADTVADTFADATHLDIGTVAYGFIEDGPGVIYGPVLSEVDTFAFTVEAGHLYTFEIAGGADYASDFFSLPPGELDTVAFLYNANGDLLDASDDISFPSDLSSRVSYFATESGTIYLDVTSYSPYTGGYSITSSEVNPADFDPLDAIIWRNAANVPFDTTNTAYVYFAGAGESFGELADDGINPLPSFGWTDYEKQQVMLALGEYEKILGTHYVITDDPGVATFRLITTESELYGAYMYPQDPAFGTQQGIAAFNILSGGWAFDQQQSLEQGGFSFNTLLHEFGHGHGLSHPHDNGGGSEVMLGVAAAQGSFGVYDLNQGVYTVMSYNDAWQLNPAGPSPFTAAGVDNGWTGTLNAFDIAALQRRYGVINPYATGNNVYTLRDVQEQGTYYQTIWDTGGTDTIRYDGALDARIDLLAATIDYTPTGGGVVSFVDGVWGGFTIAQGVVIEQATGGSGDDALLGNAADNLLTGNAGDDILLGRGGADSLAGGYGFDTASYIDASAGVRASLEAGRGYTGDAAGDRYKSVEALQGSRFDDDLTGDQHANTLDGMDGNDILRGGEGADTLSGGEGKDSLYGGDGIDDLNGGAGDDWLEGGEGADVLSGRSGKDTLYGGDGKDDLDGGAGNDKLFGGDDADKLAGGLGDDVLDGGDQADVLSGGDGKDTLYGGDGKDDLNGGAGDDWLDGGDDADVLTGRAGKDTLCGGDGKDSLDGGAGDDKLYGGEDDDALTGGFGKDWLTGGDGRDTFKFGVSDGIDTVVDFQKGQDTLDLSLTDLTFDDLDTSGNGFLDDSDAYVMVSNGHTIIDLGASVGGAANHDTVTLQNVVGLTASNLLFG